MNLETNEIKIKTKGDAPKAIDVPKDASQLTIATSFRNKSIVARRNANMELQKWNSESDPVRKKFLTRGMDTFSKGLKCMAVATDFYKNLQYEKAIEEYKLAIGFFDASSCTGL